MRPTPPPADLPALTSLRFVAAAMVFVFHLRQFTNYDWAYAIAPGMNQGVSFFFVLSGFVLAYAYHERRYSWRSFYLARFARVWPLHMVCMLALLAALPLRFARGQDMDAGASAVTFALKALLLDAWVPTRATLSSWNAVSWSLSVEAAFYAVFPLLLVAVSRRPALTLAGAAALTFLVYSAGVALGLPLSDGGRWGPTLVDLGYLPPARLFEFSLGVAACRVWRGWLAPAKASPAAWSALEAAALLATALWLFVAIPPLVHGTDGALFAWLRVSGASLGFAVVILAFAGGRGVVGRFLSLRPCVALGEASFAFYLVHAVVLRVLPLYRALGPATLSAAAFALSLALAFALRHSVEAPMRRIILGLPRRTPARPRPVMET